MKVPYKDIADDPEDERIRQIGEKTMQGMVVGFITDDEPGKPERYISKLIKRFPGIRIIYQGPGPVPETVLVKAAPPLN